MNFIAHVHVALSAGGPGDAELAFGAAMPDLASMAGLRVDISTLPPAVRQGVSLHHRTDATFHSLVEFTTGVRRLGEQLQARGLAVGPSRAVGHAGWELLLDGCLLDRPGIEHGFARVIGQAPDVAGAVSPADPARWRRLVASMQSDRWWLGYRDAEVVARRLQRRLQSRRRLCFAPDEIPLVADALAEAKPGVDLAADRVVLTVIARLAREGRFG